LVGLGVFVLVWVAALVANGGATSEGQNATPSPPPWSLRGRASGIVPKVGSSLLLLSGWAVAIGMGVALAAVQVIPVLAAISESVTAAERSGRALAGLVLDRETLLTWLVPDFFGSPLAQTVGPLNYLIYNE